MRTKTALLDYFLHPFRYIAGGKSLLWGLLTLAGLTGLGYVSSTCFDGVLDIHAGRLDLRGHALCVFGSWASAVAVFYLTALILSGPSVRLIDFAGTLALAHVARIPGVLVGLVPMPVPDINPQSGTALNPDDLLAIVLFLREHILEMILLSVICIGVLVWFIAWMYNACSVSGNLKGGKGIVSFIIALIIAEIVSKILLAIML
ncbi:MAG: hypothetical protein LBJ01_10215 [Tannerella sp.]|jgi:hypothetical protein|nr:hypothetical protein [Tannerella sp.]